MEFHYTKNSVISRIPWPSILSSCGFLLPKWAWEAETMRTRRVPQKPFCPSPPFTVESGGMRLAWGYVMAAVETEATWVPLRFSSTPTPSTCSAVPLLWLRPFVDLAVLLTHLGSTLRTARPLLSAPEVFSGSIPATPTPSPGSKASAWDVCPDELSH